jgi:ADP-ribosylglycohydrolase
MTHCTSMAVTSGFAQTLAVHHCLLSSPGSFDVKAFVRTVVDAGSLGHSFLPHTITEDDLGERLKLLERHEEYPPERIIEEFRGSPYVFESLPFTLMFFVRNPLTIDTMFDCVSSGGDADSNASMLGALLGALHGTSIFPEHLVAGLQGRDAVLAVADQFFEKFVK